MWFKNKIRAGPLENFLGSDNRPVCMLEGRWGENVELRCERAAVQSQDTCMLNVTLVWKTSLCSILMLIHAFSTETPSRKAGRQQKYLHVKVIVVIKTGNLDIVLKEMSCWGYKKGSLYEYTELNWTEMPDNFTLLLFQTFFFLRTSGIFLNIRKVNEEWSSSFKMTKKKASYKSFLWGTNSREWIIQTYSNHSFMIKLKQIIHSQINIVKEN